MVKRKLFLGVVSVCKMEDKSSDSISLDNSVEPSSLIVSSELSIDDSLVVVLDVDGMLGALDSTTIEFTGKDGIEGVLGFGSILLKTVPAAMLNV